MSADTKIAWATKTWSPLVGCTRTSPGCARCYALTAHNRRHRAFLDGKLQNVKQYAQPFEVVQQLWDRLDHPLRWRKPQRIFVNSQSDVFHEDVTIDFLERLFGVIAASWAYERDHQFLILTKRPARMLDVMSAFHTDAGRERIARAAMHAHRDRYPEDADNFTDMVYYGMEKPLPNLWLGVSVENQRWADERIPLLLQTPAAVRFLSCEPLLGPVNLQPFMSILPAKPRPDWVICGSESGKGARPMHEDWARNLMYDCRGVGVPFFMKQLATPTGRAITDLAQFPEDLRVQEFPDRPRCDLTLTKATR